MSDLYPIKAGFTGGVVSPRFRARVNTEQYAQGFSECNNWTIKPQGSIRMRRGSRFNEALATDAGRLITFPRSLGRDAVVALDGTTVDLRDRQGIIAGAGLYLKDPTLASPNTFWKQGGSGFNRAYIWTEGFRVYLGVKEGQQVFISQFAELPEDAYTLNFSYASQSGVLAFPLTRLGNASRVQVIVSSTYGGAAVYSEIFAQAQWTNPADYTFNFDTTGSGITEWYIRFQLLNTTDIQPSKSNIDHGAIYGPVTLAGSDVTPQTFASPWGREQLDDIQFAVDTGTDVMYLVHPNVAPYILDFDEATDAWSFIIATFTLPPAVWTGTNWPSVVGFHQSRLWLGASPDQRSTLWASKTGAYDNFTIGSNPDDGLEFIVAAAGTLQWLRGIQNDLLIGTDQGEFACFGQNGTITPSDFQFDQQSGYGSADVQSVFGGQQTLYVGLEKQKIRAANQSEELRGWRSSEPSIIADSLFADQIKELHYALEPDYQMYCLLQTGTIVRATYDRIEALSAWFTSTYPNGSVISMTTTSESAGRTVWLLVQRDAGIYLEIVDPEVGIERFVDSYIVRPMEVRNQRTGAYSVAYSLAYSGGYDPVQTVKVITGLSHLVEQIVAVVYQNVLPNGNIEYQYIGDFFVAVDEIELPVDAPVGDYTVGIKYVATASTLPQEGGNRAGTAQGTKRKWNRIFARLFSSALPLLNGYRPKPNVEDVPDNNVPLDSIVDGDYEVRNEGFDEGVVVISQDLPLRTEVVGIFGKAQSSAE